MKLEWRKLGEVGVDAGCLMVCDPCYVVGKDSEINARFPDGWSQFCAEQFDYTTGASDNPQVNYARGHAGLGVVASTACGDGCFAVLGLFQVGIINGMPLAMVVVTGDVNPNDVPPLPVV